MLILRAGSGLIPAWGRCSIIAANLRQEMGLIDEALPHYDKALFLEPTCQRAQLPRPAFRNKASPRTEQGHSARQPAQCRIMPKPIQSRIVFTDYGRLLSRA